MCFHRWTKWYEVRLSTGRFMNYQKKCIKCGKIKKRIKYYQKILQ